MSATVRHEVCPRCRGAGTEMEMHGPMGGRRIVCRDCSGTGRRDGELEDEEGGDE